MAKITSATMRAADIVVSTGTGASSALIRVGTLSSYSHAALYIGNGMVVEAIERGVVKQALVDALLDDVLAVVYRRKDLTATQATAVVNYVSKQVGKSYDYAGVVGASGFTPGGTVGRILWLPLGVVQGISAAGNIMRPESSFFCSELVLRAFEKAAMPITFGPATLSNPGSIPTSHKVQYVGHLKGQ